MKHPLTPNQVISASQSQLLAIWRLHRYWLRRARQVTFPDGRILRTTKTRHPRGLCKEGIWKASVMSKPQISRLVLYESLPSAGGRAARGV